MGREHCWPAAMSDAGSTAILSVAQITGDRKVEVEAQSDVGIDCAI